MNKFPLGTHARAEPKLRPYLILIPSRTRPYPSRRRGRPSFRGPGPRGCRGRRCCRGRPQRGHRHSRSAKNRNHVPALFRRGTRLLFFVSWTGEGPAYFLLSDTATATATVAPTMGLLPMPRKPIISTWAGTELEPANWASECIRPMVSVMP